MCWSATADLVAGTAISAAGIVCLARVRRARDLPVAAVLAYCLATRPVTAEIRGRTIGYVVNVPWTPLVLAGYLFATLGSLLLAGDRRLGTLGVVLAAGALACSALWRLKFASTWCTFAAVASLLVWGRVRRPYAAPPVT
ncbi:hypothetical protein OG749_42450 [Streptomyces nojiriensis]|uniref:DUF6629 family protein n=1 Tax=Streptomyces nojiriensis TaxID=66374 RepID=UPI002E170C22